MANTYLISICSYLMRFYLMDEVTLKDAMDLLKEYCVGKRTTLSKLMLPTPPRMRGWRSP